MFHLNNKFSLFKNLFRNANKLFSYKNNFRFENKVVVITGGASGIGEATCKQFAKEGAKVVIVDINQERGMKVSNEINSTHITKSHFIKADISNENDAKKITSETVEKFGDIDVLINDAAKIAMGGIESSAEDFMTSYRINVIGYFLVSKYAIESMKKKGGGAIVNLSSIAAWNAFPNLYFYSTTKAAILQMTRDMALDFGKYNIRVNCVCPGTILTPGVIKEGPEMAQIFKEVEATTIMKRVGKPEEIATVIAFLASNDASYVTGTHLIADGGYTTI